MSQQPKPPKRRFGSIPKSAGPEIKKQKGPGVGRYESNSITFSAACKAGNHTGCFALKCECTCGHP